MAVREMNRRTLAGLAAAAALGGARAFGAPTVGTRLPSSEDIYEPPTNLATIADLYRRMTAPLRVAGEGPFAFVVDTGANQSVISQDLAARLGLAQGEPSLLNGVAGVQMAPTALASLAIGRRTARPATFFVLPGAAIGGDGMLGVDGLADQVLTLDFRNRRLRIVPSVGARPGARGVAMKATRRDGQLTLVDADLAGIPVTAFIDSGAQSTIGNRALQRLAIGSRPSQAWTAASIVSVTGQTIEGDVAELPHLRVGGITLPRWHVAFADLHTFQLWDLVDRPAILLGVDALSRFEEVSLDFRRGEVIFRLPQTGNVRAVHT
jgi:hypothetical protein